jgi:hypothetical protein
MDKLNIMIDGPKALELLWFAVAEGGTDYVYTALPSGSVACSYVDADREAPGCGVGLALHKAGVPVSVLEKFDGWGSIGNVAVSAEADTLGLVITKSATDIFAVFQSVQDADNTWGLALREAIIVASRQTAV